MSDGRKPFAFIAHKDGYWAGVCSPEIPKRELQKFLGDFAASGFSIMTVDDRDSYNRQLETLKFWHDSPEYLAKHPRAVGDPARAPASKPVT